MCSVSSSFQQENYLLTLVQPTAASLLIKLLFTVDRRKRQEKQKFANALLFLSAILRFLKYIIQNFYTLLSSIMGRT
jgi:hypothetical protein